MLKPRSIQDRMRPTVMRRLLFPIVLLVLVFVATAAGFLNHFAREQNRIAAQSQHHLARSALSVVTDELQNFTRDYAFWDDTVENLIVGYDREWADQNVGNWAIDELGMDGSLVVGSRNRLLHTAFGPEVAAIDGGLNLPKDLADLVAKARRNAGKPGEGPRSVAAFFRVSGALFIGAASAIVWEDDRAVPLDGDAPGVLVFFRSVDGGMLAKMQTRFLLRELRLKDEVGFDIDTASDGGKVGFLPLRAPDGLVLTVLSWTVDRAGTEMLRTLVLPLMLIAFAMLMPLAIFVLRAHKTAVLVEDYTRGLETQARELENARSEAVEASRSKSHFLAMMSHELRTPLNAVIGFSDLLRNTDGKPLSHDKMRDYAEDIHTSGRYLLALINDILDMSKIEAQRYELFEEDVPLNAVIEQSIVLVRGLAHDRAVTVENAGTDLRLRIDERAVKQILVNLVSNAVKYSEPGGRVTITALPPRAVSGPSSDNSAFCVRIEVADTGIGMSPSEVEKALQPFGQTRDAHVRGMEGTGLGLNICKALVELHGGRLEIVSEPGVGTRVIVCLPASRLITPEVSAPCDEAAARRDETASVMTA